MTSPLPVGPAFDHCVSFVLGEEGGYSIDPRDAGNWTSGRVAVGSCLGTKFGISAASFPLVDIPNLTVEHARLLYAQHYWSPIMGDQLPLPVALVIMDCAVNQGVHCAVVTLQQAARVAVDGVMGPRTLDAVHFLAGPELLIEVCARRALAYSNDASPVFTLGWMRRLFRVAAAAAATGKPNA